MCLNEGRIDRIIRVVLGIALIAYGYMEQSYLWMGIGAIPLLTGLFGICLLYIPFKINTGCKREKSGGEE
ncbi:MAG: DUF2892 domain-containing protein [Campylobacterales bacterium]